MLRRVQQILAGFRWAARFSNPFEILMVRHLFRRKRAVPLCHDGMQVLIDSLTSDVHVVTDVLLDGMYDAHILQAGKGRTEFRYLNLGANIGTFDIRVFQLLGVRSKIEGFAVEMNPATCARLILNLEANRLFGVRAINAAIWDTAGVVRVAIEDRGTSQRCEDSAFGWPVPLLPWSQLFEEASQEGTIDLVKIDIEGAEERVVPKITTAEARRIRFLAVETHSLRVHNLVDEHLTALGLRQLSEEPGEGETHLALWQRPNGV